MSIYSKTSIAESDTVYLHLYNSMHIWCIYALFSVCTPEYNACWPHLWFMYILQSHLTPYDSLHIVDAAIINICYLCLHACLLEHAWSSQHWVQNYLKWWETLLLATYTVDYLKQRIIVKQVVIWFM